MDEDPVSVFLSLDQWRESPIDDEEDPPQGSPSSLSLTPSSHETYMLGFIVASIVGVKYYSGSISGRELVGLVREPLNPYDSNAIKVLNTRTTQVGHIERTVASVLAPLIDANQIAVEGIVPKTPGRGNHYRIPCQIHIFARIEAFLTVRSEISRSGLLLISNSDALFSLSEAHVVKEEKDRREIRSVDEIFKLVDENVSKKGALEALEPPKDVIKSDLFLHQKEGLWWLVHRENSSEMPPFWEEKDGAYVNVLTNYKTCKRPEPLKGGVFADDMGLGKTLTLLSLIAFDKSGSFPPSVGSNGANTANVDEMVAEDDKLSGFGGKKPKRGRSSKKGTASRKKCKLDDTNLGDMPRGKPEGLSQISPPVFGRKTTLIVCPPSVFSTWIMQLREHTKPGSMKVYMYYGDRTTEAEKLQKYDIVLTTYSTLAIEEHWSDSPVKKVEWWRVILDEAHMIKNANAKQSRAVTNLKAERRWAVTGTPIQNGAFDLFSLMAFLRFEPFSIQSYWHSLVQWPLSRGGDTGISRLQVLMATISLRRTKDKGLIGLPPKTVETCFLQLSEVERELYDHLEQDAKGFIQSYITSGSVVVNYSTVLSIILRLRQICTDVALCPSDLKSLVASNNIEDVSNNPELLKKMVLMLQDGEDFDCPICICQPTDTIITSCAHIFCRACILKTLKRSKPWCPLCRRPLSESDLFSAPPEHTDDSAIPSSGTSTSSKVSTLLKLLSASRDQNPKTKSVVFSQFRKMLILLEEPLKAAGFKTLRLDGSMSAKRRAVVIEEFGSSGPDGPTVLLASLKASGAGVNLTAASVVYLLEPWWNPAVEEQAMDRVHRIGQKEEVKIVRLIVQNSIEERILQFQERKKEIAREAFERGKRKDRREVTIDDLRLLMSL
ncbi:putative SWI/SNF-related matrix-associated actin-dependent regulator of chromatin subfamily A member 3-like 1 [Malania oleifera]|uniref:putative SWI/SNF-related matrix-associated actin-dependent regulator of chromatin subfamily A member 3-like 1 n=1 Tax=Malania oleifera TaxID=397392 RepID=UPI0025AE502B|nr:putative SWI/SNF-related matrix-associated actin-dependent regulator of chromatin subfamily A member 3-like 1 [Malania oleifera]